VYIAGVQRCVGQRDSGVVAGQESFAEAADPVGGVRDSRRGEIGARLVEYLLAAGGPAQVRREIGRSQ
jgi:hypothetical protein